MNFCAFRNLGMRIKSFPYTNATNISGSSSQ